MEKNILDFHSSERNIILLGDFSETEIVEKGSKLKAHSHAKDVGTAVGIKVAGRIASKLVLPIINPIGAAIVNGAADIASMASISSLLKNTTAEFTYLKVPYSQAHDFLKWKGSLVPQKDAYYIKNPHDDRVYFPADKFHTLAFEEKYNEAIRLLMALKPKNLTVEYREGYARELNAKVKGKKEVINAEADLKVNQVKGNEVLFSAEFEKPNFFSRAKKPSDLIWYPSEEKWHSLVDGVINHGLKKVEMDISYNDDFGVTANLQASIAKAIGGKIESKYTVFRQTLWKVSATFW
ncbi:hypothetical protein [Paenibacillus wynnii]|uniref:hypothetical protein n=1 Tax=Paenibacillus wynnii TaxID=268407 RepID=UPI00278E4DA0|nr:hypothetical protein [Paenibacillus wynnii]MDQ0192544.1 hypothetical protein [Paenibacillus wynnii]